MIKSKKKNEVWKIILNKDWDEYPEDVDTRDNDDSPLSIYATRLNAWGVVHRILATSIREIRTTHP